MHLGCRPGMRGRRRTVSPASGNGTESAAPEHPKSAMTPAPPDIYPSNHVLAGGVGSTALFSFVAFERIRQAEANVFLRDWAHKMGPLQRGNQSAVCHGLFHEGKCVAVTLASTTIAPVVGGCDHLTRDNTIELSRLCAARSGLCRVALRLWREFVFPSLGYEYAMSYQDADLHNGHTYRFDGWERVGRSRSGPDTRSGRPGRDKWVWAYPPQKKLNTKLSDG